MIAVWESDISATFLTFRLKCSTDAAFLTVPDGVAVIKMQGHPMDLFLKISFRQTNFLLAGRFGKNINMSLTTPKLASKVWTHVWWQTSE